MQPVPVHVQGLATPHVSGPHDAAMPVQLTSHDAAETHTTGVQSCEQLNVHAYPDGQVTPVLHSCAVVQLIVQVLPAPHESQIAGQVATTQKPSLHSRDGSSQSVVVSHSKSDDLRDTRQLIAATTRTITTIARFTNRLRPRSA